MSKWFVFMQTTYYPDGMIIEAETPEDAYEKYTGEESSKGVWFAWEGHDKKCPSCNGRGFIDMENANEI